MDLREFTLEQAKLLEGKVFELEAPGGKTISMTMEEALPYDTQQRRRSRNAPAPRRQPFALYFVTHSPELLEQGMYTLRSGDVTFDKLFIVPVGQDDAGTEYEAIFN